MAYALNKLNAVIYHTNVCGARIFLCYFFSYYKLIQQFQTLKCYASLLTTTVSTSYESHFFPDSEACFCENFIICFRV